MIDRKTNIVMTPDLLFKQNTKIIFKKTTKHASKKYKIM